MRAQEMIQDAKDFLNDPEGDLWDDRKMLRHLNRALSDVTSRARTIREVRYIRANVGQSVYSMTGEFLGNDKVSWLYNGEWYPLIKRTLSVTEYLNNSDWITSYRPFYYDIWGRTREERIVASVDEIEHNNQRFLDAEFPTQDQTFGFKFAENLRGTGDIKVGDLILNITDGSEGFVVERNTEDRGNELFAYARLENGRRTGADDGKILVGDELRILSPNVSGHALRIAPPPTEESQAGEEVLWVYHSRKHYVVEQAHIDAVNDNLELDIELETPALERLIYWCRREELGASDPESIAQLQTYEAAYFLALPSIRQRIREHESTWGTPSIDAFRANIQLEGVTTPLGHVFNRFNI